ncbi:RNA polymerase sigma-70 factor (ECF subfamily) [Branchiibius hedensis]|uniref:RNA polymerase sigma-70 factor, ECF subfamily n=1 Tax=Branchiibius hedensis TaxID=672460 RepID=A0A2Y9BUC5_9MICO|nr:DUF6596 domain-containing protein [Branchiibius hedensis]PWJ26691.1 RNA polymerase sigma-70 factor (ECF subfamily) [Branchiibius hedensis]SSA35502.1 RNA polymerase sigma-70 factor, ECF subfamily [Branchiibius hedensis]
MEPVEQLLRDEWGRLLALLVAGSRRLDLAEDALAAAFEEATRRWPIDGTPSNPSAWLLTTARRKIVDVIRAETTHARKQPLIAMDERNRLHDNELAQQDSLLRLVLLAAHPALAPEAGAALTLRMVLGISAPDIARLFLVTDATMAARLTRARKKVVTAGIPMALPAADLLPARLEQVAIVAYLAFTAGYAPSSGDQVVRARLAGEAIRLVRLVRAQGRVVRDHPTLVALQALMLLQHSRRDARVSPDGDPVLLPDQDRSRWHYDEIDEGLSLLRQPAAGASPLARSYRLQAAIAACHATARSASATDWGRICAFYEMLDELTGSPVVRLNRAVAVAEHLGPAAGLALLDDLAHQLPGNYRLAVTRAELLARNGQSRAARSAYAEALDGCANDAERRELVRRIDRLEG